MRLNLGCGHDIRQGYLNVDTMPGGQFSKDTYRQGNIDSLDWLVEDETIEEIIAMDCLEYIPMNTIKETVGNWSQKLRTNGILKILVPDCHSVAKAFYNGQLNLDEYSKIVLGTQECGGDNRLSLIDTETLVSLLEQYGLTITLKRYEGVAIYVEATKC